MISNLSILKCKIKFIFIAALINAGIFIRAAFVTLTRFRKKLFSLMKTCFWIFSGSDVVLAVRSLPVTQTGYSCIFHNVTVRHGTVVKTNARCINNVELSSSVAAEPLTVSFNPPSTTSARVEIIPNSQRLINNAAFGENGIVIQDNLTCIQAQWYGFEDITGVSHYRYTVKNNNNTILKMMDKNNRHSTVKLHGLSLRDGEVYTVEVEAVNTGGVYSEPVSASVRTDSRQPKLSGLFSEKNIIIKEQKYQFCAFL